MIRTISLTTDVTPNRELRLVLPEDVPTGPAEIVITVTTPVEKKLATLGDLARSEFFGIWSDRDDIGDTVEFARRLREEAWTRNS